MTDYPIDPILMRSATIVRPTNDDIERLRKSVGRAVVATVDLSDHDIEVIAESHMQPKWDYLNALMDEEPDDPDI